MTFNTITYTTDQGITNITLNRPDRYNAFNEEMRSELLAAMEAAEADTGCRVIVLSGSGKAFSSGQDLKDIEGKKINFSDFLKNKIYPMFNQNHQVSLKNTKIHKLLDQNRELIYLYMDQASQLYDFTHKVAKELIINKS